MCVEKDRRIIENSEDAWSGSGKSRIEGTRFCFPGPFFADFTDRVPLAVFPFGALPRGGEVPTARLHGQERRFLSFKCSLSMPNNEETTVLLDVRYWKAWWKIHIEAVPADRLLENAVRRGQYQWAAALKRVLDRSGQKTGMSNS